MDRASASGKFTEEVPPPPPRGGGLSLTSSKQKIPGSTPGMVKRGRSRLTAGFPFCFVLFCFALMSSALLPPLLPPLPTPPSHLRRGTGRSSLGFICVFISFRVYYIFVGCVLVSLLLRPPALPRGAGPLGRPAPADAAEAARDASSCYYMCGCYCCSPRAPGLHLSRMAASSNHCRRSPPRVSGSARESRSRR